MAVCLWETQGMTSDVGSPTRWRTGNFHHRRAACFKKKSNPQYTRQLDRASWSSTWVCICTSSH